MAGADAALDGGMPMSGALGPWLSRLALYLSLTGVIGFLVLAGFILPGAGALSAPARRATAVAAVAGLVWAVSAAALFLVALASATGLGLADAARPEALRQYAGTRFGMMMLLQVPAALLVAGVAAASRRSSTATAALALAALGALIPVSSGHAGTHERMALAVTCDWAHMLGATAWVGGLTALVVLVPRGQEAQSIGRSVARFSRLAGWALGLVFASGVANSVLHLRTVDDLWTTGWGRLVLVKVALFGAIALVGG